jgi:antibiotic biosynthesis monooxygenase (ABM) superfamily enzyme
MIKLQMFFEVDPDKCKGFEQDYQDSYVPALRKQAGYIGSKLLRLFPEEVAKEISAAETKYNYQMELLFDTEENRRKWVKSPEHVAAWPQAVSFVKSYEWKGYDVAGIDQVTDLSN